MNSPYGKIRIAHLREDKVLLCVIMILIPLVRQPAAVPQQTPVVFKGQVMNASRDSSGVENIPVSLQGFNEKQDKAPVEIDKKESGKNGRFRFEVIVADSASLVAAADYQGVRYYSHVVPPSSRNIAVDHDISVLDTLHHIGGVEILMHHLFVDEDNGSAGFRETLIINNPTRFALTHSLRDPSVGEATFRFKLPPAAVNHAILSPAFGNELTVHNGYLYDRGIALPGNRQVSFSYEIPWLDDRAVLDLTIDYPSRTLDLFTSTEKISVLGEHVVDHGPFQIRGTQYHRYGITNPRVGSKIPLIIQRSGGPPARQTPYPVIFVTAVLLGCGLVFSLFKQRRPA